MFHDTLAAGISTFGQSGLTWGNTYQVVVNKTIGCGTVEGDTTFLFNCNAIFDTIRKCWGDTIMLSNNSVINSSGLYADTVLDQNNQDSIIYIWFVQHAIYNDTNAINICQGQSYTLPSNIIVSSSGTYIDTLQSSFGCDSIISTGLTVHPNYLTNDTLMACSGDTITFPDNTVINGVVNNTQHTSTISTLHGCDSIIQTSLIVYPNYSLNDTLVACWGDTVTFYDNTIINGVTSNISHLSILNSNYGCDSGITTQLIVNPIHNVSIFDTICQGSAYLFNGSTYSQAGNYIANLTDVQGCDSTVTLNLYVNTVNATLTQVNDTLFANPTPATYQWYYCESSALTPISGATNNYYIIASNGDFAVVINQNGCIDTSSCISIQNLGVSDRGKSNSEFKIYPNPTDLFVTLEIVSKQKEFESYTIYNTLGQVVRKGNLVNNKAVVDLGRMSKGVYYAVIDDSELYGKIILHRK